MNEYDNKLFKNSHVAVWVIDFSKSKLKFPATNEILLPPKKILQRLFEKIQLNFKTCLQAYWILKSNWIIKLVYKLVTVYTSVSKVPYSYLPLQWSDSRSKRDRLCEERTLPQVCTAPAWDGKDGQVSWLDSDTLLRQFVVKYYIYYIYYIYIILKKE